MLYHDEILNEDNVMVLLYDPDTNIFTDEFGAIRYDILKFVTPGQLMVFKKYKGIYCILDITGTFYVQLEYPEEYEEREVNNEKVRIWSYAF